MSHTTRIICYCPFRPVFLPILALLAFTSFANIAQSADSAFPTHINRYGYDALRDVYFRLHYEGGEIVGQPTPYTLFGVFAPVELGNGLAFVDGQLVLDNDGEVSGNAGIGRRWYRPETDSILGASLWYDGDQTRRGNEFHQVGVGFEWLFYQWDFRANVYAPVGSRLRGAGATSSEIRFEGNNLYYGGQSIYETSLGGFDLEIARRVGDLNLWPFAGTYHYDGPGQTTWGAKGGLRGYLTDNLAASLTIADDSLFDTTVAFGVTWFFPSGNRRGNSPCSNSARLHTPVERNDYVVVHEKIGGGPKLALTDGGVPITVTHVDSNASGGNAGTFEDPFTSLPGTQATDIVYVHADSVFDGQNYSTAENQRLLGEGSGNQHLVQTDQLGPITLPAGNGGASQPIIRNIPSGRAIGAASGSEVSNFDIRDTQTGVGLLGGAGDMNINRTAITGATNAITVGSSTSGRVTITGVTITDPTFSGLQLTGGSADVQFGSETIDPANGLFGASTISQGTDNPIMWIWNGHNGALNVASGSSLTATNGIGLHFENADGEYTFNGPITLNGGDAGIDILDDSDGTFLFAGATSITNPSGRAVNIDGDAAGQNAQVTFNSLDINQSLGDGVYVNNTNALVVNAGEIDNTTGDGIHAENTNLTVGGPSGGVTFGETTPIGDDAIVALNNDDTSRTVTLRNNSSSATSNISDVGIFIRTWGGTGTLTVQVADNDLQSTDSALYANAADDRIVMAVDNNTLQTATGGETVYLRSAAPDSLIVTSLNGNTVVANGTGGGMRFDQVTFDASGASLLGTQVSAGGTTRIGQGTAANQRVQGHGLELTSMSGDVAFTSLNIFNSNGRGVNLQMNASTFALDINGGAIDTSDGNNEGAFFESSDSAQFCLRMTTDGVSGSGTSNDIELRQIGGSTLGITQSDLNDFSSDNGFSSIGTQGTITFDCP